MRQYIQEYIRVWLKKSTAIANHPNDDSVLRQCMSDALYFKSTDY